MYAHHVNYRKELRGSERRRPLVDVGFWLSDLPRLTWRCWVWGHKPVVDGYDLGRSHSRWVACDRCGLRPTPQGNLNMDTDLVLGQPYTGYRFTISDIALGIGPHPPGPWPRGKGEIGGQLILAGASVSGVGAGITVGCPGNDYDLAGHISLGWLGALYLHTRGFGKWFQRRLVPTDRENRVTGIHISEGHLRWEIWARGNESSRSDPWWRHGYKSIDPRVWIWGRFLYSFDKVGESVASVLSMPEEDYPVNLQLTSVESGREHGRQRFDHWSVDFRVLEEGIPTKASGRGGVTGFSVRVSEAAVEKKMWEQEALAAALVRMTHDRICDGYRPQNSMGIEVSECQDATEW